ncbi:hypothetical protein [Longimicrobium sp.]|uniref:hypothetical protein n=1 Tax=Longimicrobium sp. TaxID=2029185 RepID=UPI003B3B5954
MRNPITSILAATLAASACGRAAAEDSASPAPRWTLSERPVVEIGVADGDPHYQLYRVSAATRLSDGRIVVLNEGNASLAAYDSRGRFLFTAGRKGQGPGEFESPTWLGRVEGDTLAVWDQRLKRLSFFSGEGTYRRAANVPDADGMFPRAVGIFGDRSLAVDPGPDVFAMMQGERGVRRDSVTLQRFAADGSRAGVLARYAGNEVHVADRETGFAWNDVPFARQAYVAVAGEQLYVGDSGSGQITLYSPGGVASATLRSPMAPWRIQAADVAQYRERQLAQIEDAERRREMQATLDAAPVPELSPAFGGLAVDPDGNVWVQAYPRPAEEAVTWAVLGQDGAQRAEIRVPRPLRVMEVGRDYLLGIRTDELGVEKVEMYTVTRESGSGS